MVDSSPWLIAVAHVLLRLQAPRHPPLALRSLENKDARARFGILKGRHGFRAPRRAKCSTKGRHRRRRSGGCGASGLRAEASPRRTARGRSLKTEERGPTSPAGPGAVTGGLPRPEGTGGGPPSAGVPTTASSQCSTWEWTVRSGPPSLLRKEVIQPHLPVRLPCYDFTPITDPTFDGSLHKGLGHRLRVLPTFVV